LSSQDKSGRVDTVSIAPIFAASILIALAVGGSSLARRATGSRAPQAESPLHAT